jgi:hypothetical protein
MMSSSDEEVASPQFGASCSKDLPPVTPIVSESDDDKVVKKKTQQYKRSRVLWDRVLSLSKDEMDDDEINAQFLAAAQAFMESSKLYKLAGHKSNRTDIGMWKLAKQWPADDGKTTVLVYSVPLLADLVVGVN